MNAKALRRSLLIVLAVLSQGILAVHDTQHIDAQPSTCSVCQAHLPQISGDPPRLQSAAPAFTLRAAAPRFVRIAAEGRPYESFLSRGPPGLT